MLTLAGAPEGASLTDPCRFPSRAHRSAVPVASGPAVWAGSAGALVRALVGRKLLGKLFGYGPYLLDELDRASRGE